ncbi:MAG TPA: bifunctional DNA primase/polymerase [Pirellulaceae bacterium]
MQHPALQLAELGYRVFPLTPGQKTPLVNAWVEHASTDETQVAFWLEQYPTANWAIATDGLIVIDIDPGAEHWPDNEAHARDLMATPVIALTPRGGKHYYFRQPAGANMRNTQNGQLAEHVDTRANGGYVAAAPSIVNGKAYKWAAGEIDTRPEDLPIVPAWVVNQLSQSQRRQNTTVGNGDGTIPDGQRNGALTRLAGAMRRVGATEADILAAIAHANETRCQPPLEQKEIETIAHSVASYPPEDVTAYLTSLDIDDIAFEGKTPDDPGPLPADLLHVPGFVADVVAHNLAGAHKAQPVLAMAAALSLLATLTGRKITDTQGTRTNLYCIGVAGTSTGKQRAREVTKDILYSSGLEKMIGPESIGSAQGLVGAVEAQPAILFQLDEIGRYLKTMGDAKEAFLYNIISVMMRLFTDSASIFRSDAVVDPKRIKTIHNPHACIYGTTTPDALYNSLTIDSLQDGFLSRVLVFEGDENAAKRWINKPTLPKTLTDQARAWSDFSPGGNLSSVNPQPLVVESTPMARRIMYSFDTTAQDEQRRLGPPLGDLWPRAVEKANKLALLYACSENAQAPVVTDAAATWAVEVVTHLTKRLAFLASRWVSENRLERSIKRIERLIETSGPGGIPKEHLTDATQWCNKRERDEFLQTLIEAGRVRLQTVPTRGRPRTMFTHRRWLAAGEATEATAV